MTEANSSDPDVFTCNCGGFMVAGGITGGMTMSEKLLSCTECNNEETVDKEKVEAVTP